MYTSSIGNNQAYVYGAINANEQNTNIKKYAFVRCRTILKKEC